jgi:hypothetical protein
MMTIQTENYCDTEDEITTVAELGQSTNSITLEAVCV